MEGPVAPPDLTDYALEQLSTFHKIGAYILGAFSLCGLPHTFFGILALVKPSFFGPPGKGTSPAFIGFLFMGVGLGFVTFFLGTAIASHAASVWIRERRRLNAIYVVDGILCLQMPLGTMLGIYSLVTLTKPEVKARFTP